MKAKLTVVVAIVITLALAWAARWEAVPASQGMSVYLVNRWTGEARWLMGDEWQPVERAKPAGPWGTYDPLAK